MFSSVRQGVFFYSSRGIVGFVKERFFAQLPHGLVAALSLKPRRLFISLHEQRNEAKKFAVCTFWPTPALFSAKQKELASLKQLFVFHAPKSTFASRQKSEVGPLCFFYATSLRSLGWVFSFLASLVGVWCFSFFASLVFLSSRVERSVVKDLVYIHTTSEAMCPPRRASPASVEEREEKSSIFR